MQRIINMTPCFWNRAPLFTRANGWSAVAPFVAVPMSATAPRRSFVKSMDDRKEEKDAKAFREDIEYFLSKQEFNLFDFHERVLVSDFQ